ncbi:MAG TPA: CapA family protein, partial [Gaiellaceae bacterium]|nr:CapA family protein [Gaiellaceae bacterium]
RLHEEQVRDAREYVTLAESRNGKIPAPVGWDYVWGDVLAELESAPLAARIVNLETSITASDDYWVGKAVHYRMHPRNVACLGAARIDCCSLANNHVLDWGRGGLLETLETLRAAGMATAGAGRDLAEAAAPAILPCEGGGRLLVFAFASPTSGVPLEWAATPERAGVNLLREPLEHAAALVGAQVERVKKPGDVVIASIHWGGNWGYAIPREQRRLAHALLDAGVDLVHGHSSHHPKGFEVHRGKLVLYGCGDFLDDYEGIEGYEAYRDDLVLMYLPSVDAARGTLLELRLVPLRIERFRLTRPSRADARWLTEVMARECKAFGIALRVEEDGSLAACWKPA